MTFPRAAFAAWLVWLAACLGLAALVLYRVLDPVVRSLGG